MSSMPTIARHAPTAMQSPSRNETVRTSASLSLRVSASPKPRQCPDGSRPSRSSWFFQDRSSLHEQRCGAAARLPTNNGETFAAMTPGFSRGSAMTSSSSTNRWRTSSSRLAPRMGRSGGGTCFLSTAPSRSSPVACERYGATKRPRSSIASGSSQRSRTDHDSGATRMGRPARRRPSTAAARELDAPAERKRSPANDVVVNRHRLSAGRISDPA
jgi:hypothetical protein